MGEMIQTRFTLVVVATEDGFIARHPGHNPADWASPEEQAVFFAAVDAADWGIMGRGTHQAADKPARRRIVFSTAAPTPHWRRPSQVWVDPRDLSPADLPGLVADKRPLRHGLILGGTAVHDWFLRHGAIDEIVLSVEPCRFGAGLPVFSGQPAGEIAAGVAHLGFEAVQERRLNAAGTRLIHFTAKG